MIYPLGLRLSPLQGKLAKKNKSTEVVTLHRPNLKCMPILEYNPVGSGCRIRRLHFCKGVIPPPPPPPSKFPRYDIKLHLMVLFTNPSARAGYDTRSIFKRSLTGLNSEFSFSKTSCLTKVEEPSPSYYLPIAGGRIRGFILFPRVFAPKWT